MSGKPWLEALKATMRERGTDTDETAEKMSEALSLEGCERCNAPAEVPPAVDTQTAEEVRDSWGRAGAQADGRRLEAQGARRPSNLGEPRDWLLLFPRGSTVPP